MFQLHNSIMDPFSNENKGENLSALLYWAEGKYGNKFFLFET